MATTSSDGHLKFIEEIAQEDASGLLKAHESYGDSWKKRGGIGAYMIMIRKFDRMELAAKRANYDIVQAVRDDPRAEGVIDDIRDARRYLMLIESWLRELGLVKSGDHRDNVHVPKTDIPRLESVEINNSTKDHHPDGACHCGQCLSKIAVTNEPHVEGCGCESCKRIIAELARRHHHRIICSGEDCDDLAHHPEQCGCDACLADNMTGATE